MLMQEAKETGRGKIELGPNQRHFYAERLIGAFVGVLTKTPEIKQLLAERFFRKTRTFDDWRERQRQNSSSLLSFKRNGSDYSVYWNPAPGKNELKVTKLITNLRESNTGWIEEETVHLRVKEGEDAEARISYLKVTSMLNNGGELEENTYEAVARAEKFLKELKQKTRKSPESTSGNPPISHAIK